MRKCFVHRRKAVSHAHNSLAIAKRFIESLPQCQRYIFDGVMSIYMQIPLCLHGQVEQPMHSQMGQHVIEKPDPSGDLILAQAIQVQPDIDLCLICLTCYFNGSHAPSFNACISLSVSSGLPTLMRMWSRRPGLLKYLTRMPCSCANLVFNSKASRSTTRQRMKFDRVG